MASNKLVEKSCSGEGVSDDGMAGGIGVDLVRQDERVATPCLHGFVHRGVEGAEFTGKAPNRGHISFEYLARLTGEFGVAGTKPGVGDVNRTAYYDVMRPVTGIDEACEHCAEIADETVVVERKGRAGVPRVVGAIKDGNEVAAIVTEQIAPEAGKAVVSAGLARRIGRVLQHCAADALVAQLQSQRGGQPNGPVRLGIDRGACRDTVAKRGQRSLAGKLDMLGKACHGLCPKNSSTMAAVQLKLSPPSGAPVAGS